MNSRESGVKLHFRASNLIGSAKTKVVIGSTLREKVPGKQPLQTDDVIEIYVYVESPYPSDIYI